MNNSKEYLFEGTWETEDLRKDLAPYFGKVVPDTVIERYVSSLAVFTPKGLAWVLPQYLSYALRNPKSEAGDYVVYHLSSANPGDSYWKDRLSYFGTDAKNEIIRQLRMLGERSDMKVVGEDLTRAIAALKK